MTTFTHGHCKVTKTHRNTTMIAGIDRRVPPCTFVVACLAHQAHLGPLPSLRTIVTHDPCMSKTATHACRHRQNAIGNRYRRQYKEYGSHWHGTRLQYLNNILVRGLRDSNPNITKGSAYRHMAIARLQKRAGIPQCSAKSYLYASEHKALVSSAASSYGAVRRPPVQLFWEDSR